MPRVSDTRVVAYDPLLSPAALHDELPLNDANQAVVEQTRAEMRAVLDGEDDRQLMVMGPCSVHDPVAAVDYAGRLGARSSSCTRLPCAAWLARQHASGPSLTTQRKSLPITQADIR